MNSYKQKEELLVPKGSKHSDIFFCMKLVKIMSEIDYNALSCFTGKKTI